MYRVIEEAYNDKPEYEKDIWDLRKLGIELNLSSSHYRLNFTKLSQPWLRQAAKYFIKYSLSSKSAEHCRHLLRALNTFSNFLMTCERSIQPSDVDRKLIIEFLNYLLARRLSKSSRKDNIINLKTFFKTCARENFAPVPDRQLFYEEDTPRRIEFQPRYIPEEVMVQLNQHINALPPHIMRMVLVHEETGRRINELCTMQFNCLRQDTHGDFFLNYVNSKMKREKSIPISKEVATVILEQQKLVKDEWGKDIFYLFPQPKPHGKGQPIKQRQFNEALNWLAYEKNICDATGKIWRFQSDQFRHTVGTRMANLGVPIHIIKQFLHDSFEMTMRYVAVHDQTMKEEFIKFKDRMVDVTGKVVSYESVAAEMKVMTPIALMLNG